MLSSMIPATSRVMHVIMRKVITLLLPILSISCGSLYNDSLNRMNSIPLPAFIEPFYARGVLDPSFGNHGIVRGVVSDGDVTRTYSNSIITDKNGKIYVVGRIYKFSSSEMVLWRFNPDGSPDTTFGSNGFIRSSSIATDGDFNYDNSGEGISIDAGGVVYIVGYKKTANHNNMCIWKYDELANINKFEIFTIFDLSDYDPTADANCFGMRIKIDSKGRIVVLGGINSSDEKLYLAIWRYNKNGLLDQNFNETGLFVGDGSESGHTPADISYCGDFVFDEKERIVICGSFIYEGDPALNPLFTFDVMWVWRIDGNGMPDVTFGSGGQVISDGAARNNQSGGMDRGISMVIDSQNRILIAGTSQSEMNYHVSIWCYDDKGILDNNFGTNGILISNSNSSDYNDLEMGSAIILDSRNRLLVSGYNINGIIVRRYHPNGEVDFSFGANGILKYELTTPMFDYVSMILDNAGKILLTDEIGVDSSQQMTLWRFK